MNTEHINLSDAISHNNHFALYGYISILLCQLCFFSCCFCISSEKMTVAFSVLREISYLVTAWDELLGLGFLKIHKL